MMRTLVMLLILLATLCFSCSSRTELSDLEFRRQTQYVYLDGKAFTGEAWSSDNKTIRLVCKNGIVQSLTAYHENGTKAIESTSLLGEGKCFDDVGNPIKIDDFMKSYPALVDQIAAMTYEIKGI